MIYDLGSFSLPSGQLFLLDTPTSNTTPTNTSRVILHAQHESNDLFAVHYHHDTPASHNILTVESTRHQQPQCLPDPSTLPARVLLPIGHCLPSQRDEHERQVIDYLAVCAYLTYSLLASTGLIQIGYLPQRHALVPSCVLLSTCQRLSN
jgi:hypothetical protein